MIVAHARVTYPETNNPIASPEGTKAMAAFIRFMESQTDFPGLKPIYVGWRDQRPARGYAFFECQDLEQLRAFLALMPNQPGIEVEQVHDLETMAARAVQHLSKG